MNVGDKVFVDSNSSTFYGEVVSVYDRTVKIKVDFTRAPCWHKLYGRPIDLKRDTQNGHGTRTVLSEYVIPDHGKTLSLLLEGLWRRLEKELR